MPSLVDSDVIVFCNEDNPIADSPVTCCSFTSSLSNSINAPIPLLIELVTPKITLVTAVKAANLLTAKPACLPNSSISDEDADSDCAVWDCV